MTSLDVGLSHLRMVAGHVTGSWERVTRWLKSFLPTRLYARAVLIIIAPMVVLHWNMVTRRLSAAVTQDVAALIDVYGSLPDDRDHTLLRRIAQQRLGLTVDILPGTELPPIGQKPFFSLLDLALSDEIRKQIGRPFWIDTVGRSALVEIRIQLEKNVMRIFAPRSAAYASNSEIFLLWMVAPRWS
jgi:two-component system osmolarity sensor histidine kinase EnvZ